jgi:hypothetical protein
MLFEKADAHGVYEFVCYGSDGKEKWRETINNVVTVVGKDLALDTYLANSSGYTVTGPYIGLITSTSFTAVSSSDTMSSHSGWLESTAYSGTSPLHSSGV